MSLLPIYEPFLDEVEERFVSDCVRSSWISSIGPYIDNFQNSFAKSHQAKHAVAVCNGTVALHLALHALGIGSDDEVLLPTLTFAATANAVLYTGAKPVLVDSEKDTWNLSFADAEQKITSHTKAIVPVHLYGHPACMDKIMMLAKHYHLYIVEDAAEAHFARIAETYVGTFGDAGIFSFFGNKIITTGEGGIILTNNDALAERLRFLRDHGMSREKRYWHPEVGFNYRMTSLQASVGLAQLSKITTIIERKRHIARLYTQELTTLAGLTLPPELDNYTNVYWLYTFLIHPRWDRDRLILWLREKGIDSRPVFYPLHLMPPYRDTLSSYPVAECISKRGLSLPPGPGLKDEDIIRVTEAIKSFAEHAF